MIRYTHTAIGLCLILVLTCALVPKPARADDDSLEKPIRLYANAAFGPIGKVFSLGAVEINGRRAVGEQAIWGGDMLAVSADSSACVFLDSVGQITLKNAAMARLATALSGFGDNGTHVRLVASLVSGDMIVRLQQDAEAYIETCGSAFTSSSGASFQLGVRKGQAAIDVTGGAVWADALIPQPGQPVISRVEFNRNLGRYVDLGNAPISQNRHQPRPLTAQLKRRKGPRTNRQVSFTPGVDLTESQLAQDEEFIADTPVLFELTPADIGSINPQRVRTDAQGLAPTTLTAGPKAGRGKLKVTAEETGVSREWDVIVLPGFWTTQNKILIVAAAVGAVVTCIGVCGKNTKPIVQEPPPIIR